jgi:hypothetical protein
MAIVDGRYDESFQRTDAKFWSQKTNLTLAAPVALKTPKPAVLSYQEWLHCWEEPALQQIINEIVGSRLCAAKQAMGEGAV